ncbi:Dabb family protein [Ketobacter sp. MCCC 1A13808]|uniref:Dabb family protein n=1 Tax=Ketobacter sp. MCCC 1A13808 TaxID=2602738 RepID=UPI0012EBBB57|nr:Dabb family protein [Ketobacter sp. MCCC 1A13808]MVF14918.1 Dabb family protein [Ketobacter sp. MCCC 1A13808]
MIKRVAMWRLKDKSQAHEMKEKLQSLEENVPSIHHLEVGINQSDSAKAFDIVFIATFENQDALHEFENDSFHQSISSWVSSAREIRHFVDFETE